MDKKCKGWARRGVRLLGLSGRDVQFQKNVVIAGEVKVFRAGVGVIYKYGLIVGFLRELSSPGGPGQGHREERSDGVVKGPTCGGLECKRSKVLLSCRPVAPVVPPSPWLLCVVLCASLVRGRKDPVFRSTVLHYCTSFFLPVI